MTAKAEAESLMQSVLPFAWEMLERYGEFLPFAGALRVGGRVTDIAGEVAGEEHPKSAEILAVFDQSLRELSEDPSVVALATVFMTTVRFAVDEGFEDAVCVRLEHREGWVGEVCIAYKVLSVRDGISIQKGRRTALRSQLRWFPPLKG